MLYIKINITVLYSMINVKELGSKIEIVSIKSTSISQYIVIRLLQVSGISQDVQFYGLLR